MDRQLARVSWMLVLVCGCGKPVCSSGGTPDIPAEQGSCDKAWYHGEQMCPQEVWCGRAIRCFAFSEQYGTCTCGKANDQTCCPIAIVEPEAGATLSMADDVDGEQPGLQVTITVDIDCWYLTWAQLFVHVCDQPPGEEVRQLDSNPDFHIPADVDLGMLGGCISVCAEMMGTGFVLASDSVQVCIE